MKKTLLVLLLVFIAIQLVPVDRTNMPVDKTQNFVDIQKPPQEVEKIIKNACYDCHSNETKYPNYAYVAPISWSVKHHINEGREHLNFSTWAKYNSDQKEHILEECIKTIQEGEMPMRAYVNFHEEAKLTQAQRDMLVHYFNQLKVMNERH